MKTDCRICGMRFSVEHEEGEGDLCYPCLYQQDSFRFQWWFMRSAGAQVDVNEMLQGVREGWKLKEWRAWVDKYIAKDVEFRRYMDEEMGV